MTIRNMSSLIKDFTKGPLDFYRKKASFDWKKLKVYLETEEVIQYQNELYAELQKYPDYKTNDTLQTASLDKQRQMACRQNFIYKTIELLSVGYIIHNLKLPSAATRIMMQFSPSSTVKFSVTDSLFTSVLRSMGTTRHAQFLEDSEQGKIIGCYCLTEIAHGSNVKGMQTTATYDKQKKRFVLHSEDFKAAKCWAGGLGQMATHALVYAQLITDDVNEGLHCFVVPVRNPETLLPYPGIIVGDMGEKIGLNGVDNGFIMFNKYEIPRENLLNKIGDVSEDGKYLTPFKDPNKRHGAALGALSVGRVTITTICEAYGFKALTIAIRYAAVRKQFGPDDETEVALLEYQTHQYRLLPYLAAGYVLRIFSTILSELQYKFLIDSVIGENKEIMADLGTEMHAVSSASKPISGWTMKEAIQECREACGGHGYLKVAGIGDIRNDHDANLTYEGENHILIQQNSNWLLKMWPLILKKQKISTPMKSANFLSNGLHILNHTKFTARTVDEMCLPENIISLYQWLVCYLLQRTYTKLENDLANKKEQFWAKNDNQVFYAKNLSIAFIQHFMLQVVLEKISEAPDLETKTVLTKLFSLYGLFSLEKHLPTMYQGGMAVGAGPTTLVQDAILKLCSELKDDAVALVDVFAPPDFVLNSVLGSSDGEVYKHLQSAILRSPYALSRPTWWQEITNWKERILTSKL